MKRVIFYLAIPVVFSISVFVCRASSDTGDEKKTPNSDSTILNICYAHNVETLALIYNLSNSGDLHFELNPSPRAMLARVLTKRFIYAKQHDAVLLLNELLEDDLVDSYDIGLSLYNSPLPEYKQIGYYPEIYYEHDSLSRKEILQRFLQFHEAVSRFYIDMELESFFNQESQLLYKKLMDEVKTVTPSKSYIQVLENYYGIKKTSYTIVVSAFSFNGIGRSNTVITENETHIYQLVTSNPLDESDTIDLNELDKFTVGYTNPDYFREVATHELAHCFFHDDLQNDQHLRALIDEIEYLFTDSLRLMMQKQGYYDWITTFEEHLVRLGEVSAALQLGNQEFAQSYLKQCIQERGFIYMEEIQEILKIYEENRKLYPTITDFIPILITELKIKHP